ncbi:MAG TPA: DUF2723 domain-containing protein, partial [Vicinamibacterales bacterium]|nr:DUF2723 domain-containing protein [Vicinamibacterales bacterium]
MPLWVASGFLVAHLAFLPSTPTGVDAANFVLGVRDFDVTDHRPHPPGYPVFVALGKASAVVLRRTLPTADETRLDTYAVAIWSVVFGTLTVLVLKHLFAALDAVSGRAEWAAAMAVTCPLFWFNGMRAMSDVSGLAAASLAQALALFAISGAREGEHSASRRLVIGAFVTGVAAGVRSQVIWLALPLLIAACIVHVRTLGTRAVLLAVLALTVGGLVWSVPLVATTGGLDAYVAALTAQAEEDVASGHMLATHGDAAMTLDGIVRTMAYPWANKYLAGAVLGLATIGAIATIATSPSTALLLILAFGPYAIYHLLFHDTEFLRYALPLVPATAYLAVRGADALSRDARAVVLISLVIGSLCVAVPATARHGQTGSPSLRALKDVRAAMAHTDPPPILAMHHAVSRVTRLEPLPPSTLASPPGREWLELVKYWRDGGQAPIWFLAEPERTDLALIDPHARRLVRSYRLPVDRRFFMSGSRPSGVDWLAINPPGWFAAEGWALTPESGGVAAEAGRGPAFGGATAYVRRRDGPAVLMIGGRHLLKGGPAAKFELLLDGRTLDEWIVPPDPGSFLRFMRLSQPGVRRMSAGANAASAQRSSAAPEAPSERYALVQVRSSTTVPGSTQVRTSVEQFDVQSVDQVVAGYGEGWFEQEYDPDAVRHWRWMGPRAVLKIHHADQDLVVKAEGYAPVSSLGGAATLTVRSGDAVVHRNVVSGAFSLHFQLPAATLARSAGEVVFESDRTFVPGGETNDRRTLALR